MSQEPLGPITPLAFYRGRWKLFGEGMLSCSWYIVAGVYGMTLFMTSFLERLGAKKFHIGLAVTAMSVTGMLQVFAPYAIERFKGCRLPCMLFAYGARVLWIPIILIAFGAALGGERFAPSQELVLIILGVVFLATLSARFSVIPYNAWMAGLVPEDIRGRFFATKSQLIGISQIATLLAVGPFLGSFDPEHKMTGYAVAFAVLMIVGAVGIYLFGRVPDVPLKTSGRRTSIVETFKVVVEDRDFRFFLASRVIDGFAGGAAAAVGGLLLVGRHYLAITEEKFSTFPMIASLVMILMISTWGRLSDKYGPKPVAMASMAASMFLSLVYVFVTPANWAYIVYPEVILGAIISSGAGLALSNIVLVFASKPRSSHYMAVLMFSEGAAAAVGALVGATVSQDLPTSTTIFGLPFGDLKVVILAVPFVRVFSLVFLARVKGIKGVPVGDVLRQFRATLYSLVGVFRAAERQDPAYARGVIEDDDGDDDEAMRPAGSFSAVADIVAALRKAEDRRAASEYALAIGNVLGGEAGGFRGALEEDEGMRGLGAVRLACGIRKRLNPFQDRLGESIEGLEEAVDDLYGRRDYAGVVKKAASIADALARTEALQTGDPKVAINLRFIEECAERPERDPQIRVRRMEALLALFALERISRPAGRRDSSAAKEPQ